MEASIATWERRDYRQARDDWFGVKMALIGLAAAIAYFLSLVVPTVHASTPPVNVTTQEACQMVKAGMPVHGATMTSVREKCAANGVDL